jgi:energy-coupling factor transport system ATP-binding protein
MIRLENVTCAYPGAPEPTLRGVDLRVAPGRCVLLRGGSGGGKSTLVRLACGVIPHLLPARVTGRVLAAGADVGAQALHETGRTLASVFQDCRSQFFMTHVAEELVFAADNYGRPRERTAARLARFAALMDVTGLMERSVFRLSSGERQRVAIAAAAVQGPEALVLDEPSATWTRRACAVWPNCWPRSRPRAAPCWWPIIARRIWTPWPTRCCSWKAGI